MIPKELFSEAFCYLTTTGRVTGAPHTIEIWFAADEGSLYLLSGGGRRSDWIRNLEADPKVIVRIGGRSFDARARLITDAAEERRARDLVFGKYAPTYGGDLSRWRETASPVALDLASSA